MSKNKTSIRFLVLCLSFILHPSFSIGHPATLKIRPDYQTGIPVSIYKVEQWLVTNEENFSSHLFHPGKNADRQTETTGPHGRKSVNG